MLEERAQEDPSFALWMKELREDEIARPILEGMFSNSPFLTECALADLGFLRSVLTEGPDAVMSRLSADLKDRVSRELDEDRVRRELRIAKRRAALAVALADLSGHWLLERVTHCLSDFADVALSTVISHLLLKEAEKGELVLADPHFPEDDCGFVALAMGKHGARELNYSSDIDLIVLFDPVKVDYRGRRTVQELFVKMTQKLMSLLQARTADGYVFRVDLNLRPDPGATPVAVPYAAARSYYATRGQNWERAAMIKARSAAGDVALGQKFLAGLEPFVWRDRLDFRMIRDIRALKRRLNAERGGAEIAFYGHNVKLGRGGIREIEFFAQTQQLIFGGRDPYLRCLSTVEALTTLSESGSIDEEVTDQLTEAYEFLRQLEHRLQMVADQQTQTLPESEPAMRPIAAFMGYEDLETFREAVLHHLKRVEAHYAEFFDDAREPKERGIDFSRESHHVEQRAAIEKMGFRDPDSVLSRIRGWRGAPSAKEERGRGLVFELTPLFLEAAVSRPDPDEALALLDGALQHLEDGVGMLELLAANRALVDLWMDIVSSAPALTAELCARPALLESAVSPSFFGPFPGQELLVADCANHLRGDVLAAAAKWTSEHRFQIAVKVLRQTMFAGAAGQAASEVADTILELMWRRTVAEHGHEDAPVVLACGAYGKKELALGSPLRLSFVSGAGVAERMIELYRAISPAAPGSGEPFDIERLGDPTTSPRLLATLVEARVVCGQEDAIARLRNRLRSVSIDPRALAVEMARDRRESNDPWDVRGRRGGLDDLEALVQILRAKTGPQAAAVGQTTAHTLALAEKEGSIDEDGVKKLLAAHRLLRQVESFLGATLAPSHDVDAAPMALRLALSRAGDTESSAELLAAVDAATAVIASALSKELASP
jgi:[glutamine synthetase] adenylyltransferase / [glutamine synthetase]-adenylyl-L-tyrosine phosphorylase